jgi:aldehyde dehydrogenase (NAD+)
MAVFANSGQICSAGTRLFVERKVYDEFVERVANFGKGLKVGNGVDPDTQIGPLVSEQQYERVTGYLSTGRQEGARPVTGGQALTDGPFAKGYLVPPTVFADVKDEMRIAREEIFGPVISAIPLPMSTRSSAPATPRPLGWGAASGRAMSARPIASRKACAPAQCGSIATRRWIRPCRLAATR